MSVIGNRILAILSVVVVLLIVFPYEKFGIRAKYAKLIKILLVILYLSYPIYLFLK